MLLYKVTHLTIPQLCKEVLFVKSKVDPPTPHNGGLTLLAEAHKAASLSLLCLTQDERIHVPNRVFHLLS